jgi:hypothetical protein
MFLEIRIISQLVNKFTAIYGNPNIPLSCPQELSRYSDRLRAGRPGFGYGWGQEICYLFHSVQTGSEAHPASYSIGARKFPLGESGRGVKLTTHLYLVPKSRIMGLNLHSPISLHGLVLNSLSTGRTLPSLNEPTSEP